MPFRVFSSCHRQYHVAHTAFDWFALKPSFQMHTLQSQRFAFSPWILICPDYTFFVNGYLCAAVPTSRLTNKCATHLPINFYKVPSSQCIVSALFTTEGTISSLTPGGNTKTIRLSWPSWYFRKPWVHLQKSCILKCASRCNINF